MHILIAEDDLPVAKFISSGLEAERYSVHHVSGEKDVPQAVEEGPCDLLILDLNLSGVHGLEVLQQIRFRKPHLPILILTGNSRVEDRVGALEAGADDYMTKPFAFSELLARVRALLRRSSLPFEPVLHSRDLELDRVASRRASQRRLDRNPSAQGIRATGIPDAQRRTRSFALRHHPQCVETLRGHHDQRGGCAYQLFAKGKLDVGFAGEADSHGAWDRLSHRETTAIPVTDNVSLPEPLDFFGSPAKDTITHFAEVNRRRETGIEFTWFAWEAAISGHDSMVRFAGTVRPKLGNRR